MKLNFELPFYLYFAILLKLVFEVYLPAAILPIIQKFFSRTWKFCLSKLTRVQVLNKYYILLELSTCLNFDETVANIVWRLLSNCIENQEGIIFKELENKTKACLFYEKLKVHSSSSLLFFLDLYDLVVATLLYHA